MPDLKVYVVTAAVPTLGRSHADVALAAARGGADAVQFRDKTLADIEFLEEARIVGSIARAAGMLFIVNDRIDAAIAAGADGVHVGQEDVGYRQARNLAGPALIIGVSASNLAEAQAAERAEADYIGVGPVFPTLSKSDADAPLGLAGLAQITATVSRPVVAIGGISIDNIGQVIAAGAAGAAHIAAVAGAPDMTAAVIALRNAWGRV